DQKSAPVSSWTFCSRVNWSTRLRRSSSWTVISSSSSLGGMERGSAEARATRVRRGRHRCRRRRAVLGRLELEGVADVAEAAGEQQLPLVRQLPPGGGRG